MPTVKLTDAAVQRLKAPPGQRVEFFDQAMPGLCLRVAGPTERAKAGRRTWNLYTRVAGKLARLTLGTYPDLILAEARVEASKVQTQKRQGVDPVAAKAKAKAEAAAAARTPDTIEAVAERYVDRELVRRGRAPRYITSTRQNLENHVWPRWHGRDIRDIGRRDIVDLLDDVMVNGSTPRRNGNRLLGGPTAANRTLSTIRAMLNFAVDQGLIEANPALLVKRPGEETRRDRGVLSTDEIRAVLTAADATPYPYGAFFQLLLLTGSRRSEVNYMRWADLDLDAATWTLPAESVKSRRVHVVPLAPQVVDLLGSLPRLSVRAADGRRVPSPWVLTTNGLNAFRAMSGCKDRLDAAITKTRGEALIPWTIHDLRRTAASEMARLGVTSFVIARVLNHADNSVTGIYNRYEYLAEKRHALETWASYLANLTQPPGENVVPIGA